MSVIKKSLIAIGMGCLVCINTYAMEMSQKEMMTRMKGVIKIDYGIWAYEKIAPYENSHWIKQPELFKSAVTVIGDAISACFANSDEFALDKKGKPKDLITFAANPVRYDQSNWNAFICWNLINEIVKLSMKEQKIDINKVFEDIKAKALKHYKNANIENLETKLDTSIGDISEYNRVLELSTFLKSFGEYKSCEIDVNKDYTSCITGNYTRELHDIKLRDVDYGKIGIRGSQEFITLQYKGYHRDVTIRKAYGLSYPVDGKFLNTTNKFNLELEFDDKRNVWRAYKIEPFKKIKYITPSEQKRVTEILYRPNGIDKNYDLIKEYEKYMDTHTFEYKTYKTLKAAAKDVVKQIIEINQEKLQKKKKELLASNFYAEFDIDAWANKKEQVISDLKAFLEPIGIELDEDKVFDD